METAQDRQAEVEVEGSIISMDLGRRSLCLSEVLGLRPDMQIEVPFENGMTLRLRVNGRLAGRGVCVPLGSQYGVRVIEVYGTVQ